MVRIHRPVPKYSPVVQMVNAPDCRSGDRGFKSRRGCHMAPSSNRQGRRLLKPVMLSSSLTGVTRELRICAAGQRFSEAGCAEPGRRNRNICSTSVLKLEMCMFSSLILHQRCWVIPDGSGTGPENRGRRQCRGDRHLRPAPSIRSDILTGKEPPC